MKTILQVEDDPNDVFLLKHAWKKMGVPNPIQTVGDGQEAIDYLEGVGRFADREKFPFPGLVLLDLKLPYVMGLDVLKWLRNRPGAALAVIMLTASGSDADIATAYRLGVNAFLIKPSESSKLEEMVKAIRDFWLTHNTLAHGTPPATTGQGSLNLPPRFTLPLIAKRRPRVRRILRQEWPHQPTVIV